MLATDVRADYFFGWRWLLPAPPTLVMTGSDTTDQFLLAESRLQDANVGRVALINADAWFSQAERLELSSLVGANCVAIYGSRWAVRRLSLLLDESVFQVRDYGLLPPRAPRVVVPLSSRRSALSGLSLHNPGSRRARLAMSVLRQLAVFGFLFPLKRRMLRVMSSGHLQPWILNGLAADLSPASDYALYLGAEGFSRKTVALPISEIGQFDRIFKTAVQETARRKLANEAAMLRYLSDTSCSVQIPCCVLFHEDRTTSVLVQEYRPVSPSNPSRRQEAALRFLDELHSAKSEWVLLSDIIAGVVDESDALPSLREGLLRALQKSAAGLRVPVGLVHGDFAPWNCGFTAGRLVVYDWEEGRLDGLLLEDVFSYAVMPLILLQHIREPRLLAASAVALARELRICKQLDTRVIRACLAYWSLRRPLTFFPETFNRLAMEMSDGD